MSDLSLKNTASSKNSRLKDILKNLFYKTHIKILQGIPLLGFVAIVFLYPVLLFLILGEERFQHYDVSSILPYACFVLSLSGIVGILRREFYWAPFLILKGGWAVFWGVLVTVLCILTGLSLITLQ